MTSDLYAKKVRALQWLDTDARRRAFEALGFSLEQAKYAPSFWDVRHEDNYVPGVQLAEGDWLVLPLRDDVVDDPKYFDFDKVKAVKSWDFAEKYDDYVLPDLLFRLAALEARVQYLEAVK